MNLYLISQTAVGGYDTFDSAVVAAETDDAARKTNPCQYTEAEWWLKPDKFPVWATKLEDVSVKLIGTATPGTPAGVICASFNAG